MRFSLALLLVASASVARAAPITCRDVIAGESARYVQATTKALAACQARHVPDCGTYAPTVVKITRAAARLNAKIIQRCCGADQACGTSDDESLASIGWTSGFCPNLDHGDCNNLIADPGDVATCLTCLGSATADGVTALTDVPANPALARCTSALTKATTKLAINTSKALAACWAARAAGKHTNLCPDPGDGRAVAAIDGAMARATSTLCKACGGADRACGGADDITPVALGFPSTCPAVAVPGGAACGGPITTLTDLVTCVTCVAAHDVECADHAGVPAFLTYPPECASPPGTCSAGVECTSGADCPAGLECLDNGSGATRYCVGATCAQDAECSGGSVCLQYCTFAGCDAQRCVCPGFACGASEICIDDGGLACRKLCTEDAGCPPPLGVCVNSTFGSGLCINSSPCQ